MDYNDKEVKLYNGGFMKATNQKTKYCTLCSSTEMLKEFKSQYICEKCIDEVFIKKDSKKKPLE